MALLLLAVPILIVFYIVKESGKDVMVDPLAEARRDEVLYHAGAAQAQKAPAESAAPLYCPGCKTYEDVTLFQGDEAGMKRAIDTWYEDHKPHFFPADNPTHPSGAPGG